MLLWRTAHAGRRVPERRAPSGSLARSGRVGSKKRSQLPGRACRVAEEACRHMASGRTRLFSSCGEQARPGISLRLSGHLRAAPFQGRAGAIPALGQSPAGICRRAKQEGADQSALARASGVREESTSSRRLVDSGDVFHPLAWTPGDAYRLLKDVPLLWKRAAFWCGFRTGGANVPGPRVAVTIGEKKQSRFGADAMLDFKVDLALGEQRPDRERNGGRSWHPRTASSI